MNLNIVSWNIQDKFSLHQLIDRMTDNCWDLLIVLKPQRVFENVSHPRIDIDKVYVDDLEYHCIFSYKIFKIIF